MSTPIPYARMRRLLGLPELDQPTRWAVRKVRSGDRAGMWGVWRHPGDADSHELVATFPVWRDAMNRAR